MASQAAATGAQRSAGTDCAARGTRAAVSAVLIGWPPGRGGLAVPGLREAGHRRLRGRGRRLAAGPAGRRSPRSCGRPATRPGADRAAGVDTALAGPTGQRRSAHSPARSSTRPPGPCSGTRARPTPSTPASTGKVLTAAAALLALDHTEQRPPRSSLANKPGEVVIVGGGDPTLSSLPKGATSRVPRRADLDDLVAQVSRTGQEPVTQVLFDLSRYAGRRAGTLLGASGTSPAATSRRSCR